MPAVPAKGSTMTITSKTPVYGRIPTHVDPFGLMLGQQVNLRPRLRFEGEGGTGTGAGAGAGAAGAGDGGQGGTGGTGTGHDGDKPLGEAGERALEREKERRREATTKLTAFEALGLSAEDLAKLVEANDPKNPERIRRQAETEATNKANDRLSGILRTSAIREAAVTAGFADASDALAMLPQDAVAKITVDLDAGSADADGVKKLLDDLAKAKPYLLKTPGTTADHRTAGIGAGGGAAKPDVKPGLGRMANAYATNSTTSRR
jgi:hypothetical protein